MVLTEGHPRCGRKSIKKRDRPGGTHQAKKRETMRGPRYLFMTFDFWAMNIYDYSKSNSSRLFMRTVHISLFVWLTANGKRVFY